jgi:hypothetical protein
MGRELDRDAIRPLERTGETKGPPGLESRWEAHNYRAGRREFELASVEREGSIIHEDIAPTTIDPKPPQDPSES